MIFKKYQPIQYFKKNNKGKDYIVSDIHGSFNELLKLLDKVSFDKKKDRLFSVGDTVDRGPQSTDVLKFIKEKWFINVKGNHEAMWIAQKKYTPEQNKSFLEKSSYSWYKDFEEDEKNDFYTAIKFLPLAISVETESGNVIIVHADLPTATWKDYEKQMKSVNQKLIQKTMRSGERITNFNQIVPDVRAIICGHMTVESPKKYGNFYLIDTGGGYKEGYITIMDLNSLKILN